MTGQTCALPGCSKPRWPSVPHGDPPALTCGNLHHQLLMASRFNPAHPRPAYQAILDCNAAGRCALPFCEKAPYLDHSWCSKSHYLLWLREFTSGLELDQICMLPACTRHVYVANNEPPSRFCGWRHEQKFVMLSALEKRQQEPLPSVEGSLKQPSSPACVNEREHGHPPLLNSLMHALKQYAHSGIAPKNIRVIEDFYEKHPREVFTAEGHACWFIAHLKFTSKGRKLTTKGHYHWRQSGPRDKKSKYTAKYYTYEKRRGKEKEAYQQHKESTYTMKEYTMDDVKYYSLVHLVKERGSGRKQPSKHEIGEEVENACSHEDTATSNLFFWDDDSSEDSIYKGLPPLTTLDFTSMSGAWIPVARA